VDQRDNIELLAKNVMTLEDQPEQMRGSDAGDGRSSPEYSYSRHFARSVERHGSATALRLRDQQLTYGELNDQANRMAHELIERGIGPERLVAVSLDRSIDLMVSLLAVWKAGGAFVPLDPAYPLERREFMLKDSGAPLLLTQSKYAGGLAGAGIETLCVDDPETRRKWRSRPPDEPASGATADNLAYVIYTSGSTGVPKGVEISHRALLNHNQAISVAYGLGTADRVLQFGSISFDLAFEEIFPTWLNGATLVLRTEESAVSLSHFLRYVADERISVLILPTAFWHELTEHLDREPLPPGVRLVSIGGESASNEAYRRWKGRAPGAVRLINTYGPTETTITATLFAEDRSREDLPIGRPLANLRVEVLDERLQPVSPGEVGELCIGGLGLARGYRNRPDLTSARFIHYPAVAGHHTRLYRTGDRVRLAADGNLEFVGRVDNQVKIRGFRIELGEIEEVLRACPVVRDAVVLAREDQRGSKRLVAYYLARESGQSTTSTLLSHLRAKLPSYMVPSSYVRLEAFPYTPSGKIDRRALPPPGKARPDLAEAFLAPRTPIEEQMAAIWRDVLGLREVGIRDNFLDLGGDSLLALQITSRVRDTLRRELPLAGLYEAPTIEALATLLERSEHSPALSAPPITSASRERPLPVSSIQGQLWFLNQLDPDSDAYNMPAALRIRGRLNVTALERALHQVIARHEALRTQFTCDGDLAQEISPEAQVQLRSRDLTSASDKETALREALTNESRLPFDLSRAPLLRATLFRLADADHALLIVMHHSIWDGWSMGIFFSELEACYHAAATHSPPPELPELPVQYADYAHWQTHYMSGATLEREQRYWKEKLAGAPGEIRLLPAPRTANQAGNVAGHYSTTLDEVITSRAAAFAQQHRVTPFMLLLTGLAIALHKRSGQRDMVIGTVVAGRNRREFEHVIGCFMNFVPLRVSLDPGQTGGELLSRVRSAVVEAQAHQDCPFEKIVSAINPRRAGDRNPLYNIALLWHNLPFRGAFQGTDLDVSPITLRTRSALLDLRFEAEEVEGRWRLDCEYNSGLLEESQAATLMRHFAQSVAFLIQDPRMKIEDLSLAERDSGGWFRRLSLPWTGKKERGQLASLLRTATGLAGPHLTGLCGEAVQQLPI
jgi:amino acid adenylation domain-containing protein